MFYEHLSAIFALAGVVLGGGMAMLRDHFNNKSKIRLEKMRLYDKECRDAHKRLFVFFQKLSNRIYPLASGKRQAFIDAMRTYLDEHRSDLLWFSPKICDIIHELEEYYLCLTEPDLREDTREDVERYFRKDELFDTLNRLTQEAKRHVTQKH